MELHVDERFEQLGQYLRKEIIRNNKVELGPDTPLITSGLMDSLSLISVLTFVEDEFSVVIPDEAATAASMNTMRMIVELADQYDPRREAR